MSLRYVEQIAELERMHTPFVEVVLVDARGSYPTEIGSKAIVTTEGLHWGTVGGGKVEAKAIAHAREMLSTRAERHAFFVWNLQKDVGMTCGGEVKLYFEAHGTKTWNIAVFGAGHVAQALIPLLCTLDCRVHCFDPRTEWIEPLPSHPKLLKKVSADPKVEVVALPSETFFVLISQGHATDMPVLREILMTRKAPFVGVIGSDSKRRILQKELRESGVQEELLDQFFCPIGHPVGNSSPAEIAVSITAQLLEKRDASA